MLVPELRTGATRDIASAWDFAKAKLRIDWIRFLTGIGYERSFEYPWVFNSLGIRRGMRVLDVGSSATIFPLFVTATVDCFVSAVDIDRRVLRLRQYAQKMGLGPKIQTGQLEIVHLRSPGIPYPDAFFDRISCISTIEHNPNTEDTKLIVELMRVLKNKTGLLALTFPLTREHQEIYIKPGQDKTSLFHEHRYSFSSLSTRLVQPSGGRVEKMSVFGEKGFEFGKKIFYNGRLQPFTFPLRSFAPLLASIFISELRDGQDLPERSFCCLLLRKWQGRGQ